MLEFVCQVLLEIFADAVAEAVRFLSERWWGKLILLSILALAALFVWTKFIAN